MAAAGGWTYCLALAGPVPASLVERVRDRFGPVAISAAGGLGFLDGLVADQSAVRALLTLVWDAGAEVRLLALSAAPAVPALPPG